MLPSFHEHARTRLGYEQFKRICLLQGETRMQVYSRFSEHGTAAGWWERDNQPGTKASGGSAPSNYGPLRPRIPPVCRMCYLTFSMAVPLPRTQAIALTSVDVYVEKVDNPHCSDKLIEASKTRIGFRILIADRFIMVCEPGVCLVALLFRTKYVLSYSVACGIFPDQGSNLCPLYGQANSYPLCH